MATRYKSPTTNNNQAARPVEQEFFCFTRDVFFFATRSPSSSTDRHETLPHDRNLAEFYNATYASPKIRGDTPPQKFGGQKHAKFRSILDHFRL